MTAPPVGQISPKAGEDAAKRRRERWAIGIVAVLVAVLTFFEAHLAAVGGSVAFSSNIVIFALINLNVILVVLLIFLVTRNVFKILLDRRRNLLGAKLRSRLVLIFICFSLIPTVLLFIAATNITTTSIKSWIGGRVGQALTGAIEIAQERLEAQALALSPAAERAARGLADTVDPASFPRVLESARSLAPADTALLFFEKNAEVAKDGEVPPAVRAEVLKRIKALKGDGGGKQTLIGDEFAAAWRRTPGGVIVVAVRTLPPAEAGRIREIARAYDEYHQVRLLDDPIRASYVGILILITLLIVFAASWMGIYLARQITVPVQLLAEGTEEVARGNLDVSLDYRSSDEFGTLVASFNRMTADLKAMKGNLEETNASLTRTFDELRRRTQFIETILHSISTGVIVIDRHGRIAMINKVAERLLRITKEGAVGHLYREVLREEHYEAIRGLYREAGEAAGGQIERQVELVVGEKRIAFRVSLTALRDDAGEYMGLVAAFDDLSQAMRLQRVLAWREVARRIAHDIRNPLTPIQLSTERMQRKYAATHAEDPVFVECTQAILSGVHTLKRLVDEFTRFARMPVLRLEEGDLPGEIRAIVDTYRTSHPGIRWEFRQEGPPGVHFDPFQIRRAVTNLLDNAAAALGERGSVTVTCTHDEAAGKARIDVADDGPGIPSGDRDRLFEPYFSRREGGTGLGLAIVSAIASDHGGVVRMRDNTPRGAVFEMEFPSRLPANGSIGSGAPGIDDGRRGS
ncbi:sensor histidine kinase [Candidatus Deferrimicrobium sp.]|uniref:sensor histidine kinase n=1 Tax=Candidatus Deferrimicrobium sp. TaxID=3060586 RepID=UPI002ED8955E